jgi:amino acid transporter
VKIAVLLALAGWGIAQWNPPMLSRGVEDAGLGAALFGAASVFMAYEGFQLLTYDYNDIAHPQKTLPRAVLIAIASVIVVYILVSLGVATLIGADAVIAHEEVALSIAGRQALGVAGLVIVTVAAAFSTGSAINSTLFATARLSHEVAKSGELPRVFEHRNSAGVPGRAVVVLGTLAAILAAVGTITMLVEAASLAFLFTFTVVCALAWIERAGHRAFTGFGAVAGAAATIALTYRLSQNDFVGLLFLVVLVLVAVFGRPYILRKTRQDRGGT